MKWCFVVHLIYWSSNAWWSIICDPTSHRSSFLQTKKRDLELSRNIWRNRNFFISRIYWNCNWRKTINKTIRQLPRHETWRRKSQNPVTTSNERWMTWMPKIGFQNEFLSFFCDSIVWQCKVMQHFWWFIKTCENWANAHNFFTIFLLDSKPVGLVYDDL